MPSSFRAINYVLRPAKHVERKMLRDTFRRLAVFSPLEAYRYIGFGSIYFGDFQLFHKSLGITDMLSIEHAGNEERVAFNRPYQCVSLAFGASEYILRRLSNWGCKTILWLDYDGPLNRSVLNDVTTFCTNAVAGSMIVVTMNADPGQPQSGTNPLARLKQLVDGEQLSPKVPEDVRPADLVKWGLARVSRRIVRNQILETLTNRNGGLAPQEQLRYQQLFHFHYADGARMLTTGGLIYAGDQRSVVEACGFQLLDFLQLDMDSNDAFEIVVPQLTYREVHHLDAQLPLVEGQRLAGVGIPQGDLDNYTKIYQYHSTFAETEF